MYNYRIRQIFRGGKLSWLEQKMNINRKTFVVLAPSFNNEMSMIQRKEFVVE